MSSEGVTPAGGTSLGADVLWWGHTDGTAGTPTAAVSYLGICSARTTLTHDPLSFSAPWATTDTEGSISSDHRPLLHKRRHLKPDELSPACQPFSSPSLSQMRHLLTGTFWRTVVSLGFLVAILGDKPMLVTGAGSHLVYMPDKTISLSSKWKAHPKLFPAHTWVTETCH